MSSGQSRITISRKLFTVAILVAILITACVSYTVLALIRTNTSESRLRDSGADPQTTSGNSNQTIANEENIFPTPSINQNGTIACPTGNWSSVYSFYED